MPADPTLLATYRKKRDFSATPEPSGARAKRARAKSRRFVVQLHRASHLHYDFRLEAGGTLKSWAVPKGPSLDPRDKRLAMQVEDHPLDYAGFEGRIPEGNYGAGEVIVWDRGWYEPVGRDDPAQQIAKGHLTFILHGEKLRGEFALIRMKGGDRNRDGKSWLLVKADDRYARKTARGGLDDRSAVSGKTLDDIAKARNPRRWVSNRSSGGVRTSAEPEITHPDKVMYPRDRYTKEDVAAYYAAVAKRMVPLIADRPLTLQRYPNGIAGPSFFAKNAPQGAPSWLRTESIAGGDAGTRIRYVICDDAQTLAYLSNIAALTLHVWTSKTGSLDTPDFVFFDLDPGERCPLARLVRVALGLRDLLQGFGLPSAIKTSGGSGFHVLVPLRPEHPYEVVRAFGELVARRLAAELPDDVTLIRSTGARPASLVYFDYVQIGRGKTMVAPYSLRARDGAPVSMPIDWKVIESLRRTRAKNSSELFQRWTLETVPKLMKAADPWKKVFAKPADLERAIERARPRTTDAESPTNSRRDR